MSIPVFGNLGVFSSMSEAHAQASSRIKEFLEVCNTKDYIIAITTSPSYGQQKYAFAYAGNRPSLQTSACDPLFGFHCSSGEVNVLAVNATVKSFDLNVDIFLHVDDAPISFTLHCSTIISYEDEWTKMPFIASGMLLEYGFLPVQNIKIHSCSSGNAVLSGKGLNIGDIQAGLSEEQRRVVIAGQDYRRQGSRSFQESTGTQYFTGEDYTGPLSPENYVQTRKNLLFERQYQMQARVNNSPLTDLRNTKAELLRLGVLRNSDATMARLNIGGRNFYGTSEGMSNEMLSKAWKALNTDPKVSFQTLRHAEGDVLLQALFARAFAENAVLWVTRKPCEFCANSSGLQRMMPLLGLRELQIRYPRGKMTLRSPRK
jgi:hypothetical protein